MASKNRENIMIKKRLTPRHGGTKDTKKYKIFNSLCALRALVPLCGALLVSCQTVPKAPDFSLDNHLPLEPDGYIYMIAEKDALPILNQLMLNTINNIQFQLMVDRTQFIAAAIYTAPHSHYRLAAWGNYPASRAKMALNSSKEWKKHRSTVSGANYWHSAQDGISIAISASVALIASASALPTASIDPFFVAPGTALPEGFAAFREGSILACWLNNPGPAINQKISEMGIPELSIPAEQIFISLSPEEGQRYVARLQIQIASETQARALAMAFVIARNFIPQQADKDNPMSLLASVLFANPPIQDGKNFNITSAPLTAQEIALLLKLFSL